MTVRTLSRYLLARFCGYFVTILIVILTVIAISEILLHVEDILEADDWVDAAVAHLALKIPALYFSTLIPIAAFAASFACLGVAARWSETIAMKAAGISPIRAALPILCAGAFLAVLTLTLNETLVLQATRAWDRRERGEDGQMVFRRGSFWYQRGNVIYNVRYADPETGTWRGVSLFELDDRGRLLRSIRAARVQIEDESHWRFRDVTIRRFDPSDPLSPPSFERLDETRLEIAGAAEHALRDADAAHLSLPDLREYIRARTREGEDVAGARGQFHARLAQPLAVLLFAGLAIPFGLRVEESRSLAIPALLGVTMIAAFLFLRTLGLVLIREGVAPPAVTEWAILAGFTGFGAWRFSRIPR